MVLDDAEAPKVEDMSSVPGRAEPDVPASESSPSPAPAAPVPMPSD